MSEPESFAARWSRLKQESAKEQQDGKRADGPAEPQSPAPAEASPVAKEMKSPRAADPSDVPFDIESLPPLESITAGSDIKAFLQSGVPAHLTKAALRRAWSTDPAISDFIGLAENQWDFTDPAAIPGFGPLEPTDDIRRAVAQAMGRLGEPSELPPAGSAGSTSHDVQTRGETATSVTPAPVHADSIAKENILHEQEEGPVESQRETSAAAVQQTDGGEKDDDSSNRRTHGRALPR